MATDRKCCLTCVEVLPDMCRRMTDTQCHPHPPTDGFEWSRRWRVPAEYRPSTRTGRQNILNRRTGTAQVADRPLVFIVLELSYFQVEPKQFYSHWIPTSPKHKSVVDGQWMIRADSRHRRTPTLIATMQATIVRRNQNKVIKHMGR